MRKSKRKKIMAAKRKASAIVREANRVPVTLANVQFWREQGRPENALHELSALVAGKYAKFKKLVKRKNWSPNVAS